MNLFLTSAVPAATAVSVGFVHATAATDDGMRTLNYVTQRSGKLLISLLTSQPLCAGKISTFKDQRSFVPTKIQSDLEMGPGAKVTVYSWWIPQVFF